MTAETLSAAVRRAQSMKTASWAAAFAALACVGSLRAHHSSSMFDDSVPIWIKGTVVRAEPANPHAWIVVEENTADGSAQQWTVEGPIQARLNRMGVDKDFLKPGDVIEVCGFALKAYGSSRGAGPDPYRSSTQFVHGHMLVLPDGRKRLWAPYGKLNNCVRLDDSVQSWVDFLNADPLAWEAWCTWRPGSTPSVVVSNAFLDEVKRSLDKPCAEVRP